MRSSTRYQTNRCWFTWRSAFIVSFGKIWETVEGRIHGSDPPVGEGFPDSVLKSRFSLYAFIIRDTDDFLNERAMTIGKPILLRVFVCSSGGMAIALLCIRGVRFKFARVDPAAQRASRTQLGD